MLEKGSGLFEIIVLNISQISPQRYDLCIQQGYISNWSKTLGIPLSLDSQVSAVWGVRVIFIFVDHYIEVSCYVVQASDQSVNTVNKGAECSRNFWRTSATDATSSSWPGMTWRGGRNVPSFPTFSEKNSPLYNNNNNNNLVWFLFALLY